MRKIIITGLILKFSTPPSLFGFPFLNPFFPHFQAFQISDDHGSAKVTDYYVAGQV